METKICPVCLTGDALVQSSGEVITIECPVCKLFSLTRSAEAAIRDRQKAYPQLSAWIREQHEYKRLKPEIDTKSLKQLLKSLTAYRPSEKQHLLLRAIERRSDYPGSEASIRPKEDYPLAWANNEKELVYLLDSLRDRRLVTIPSKTLSPGLVWKVMISPEGWDYLDTIGFGQAFESQAFVAMSFDKQLNYVWEKGISPALIEAGYKPMRADSVPHSERIDAKIISDIKDSYFMVADVTGQNRGVYFEAGYAIGLGRRVIWTVKKDELEKVHFDTRQFNHVLWERVEELRENLYYFICAIIGKGKKDNELSQPLNFSKITP